MSEPVIFTEYPGGSQVNYCQSGPLPGFMEFNYQRIHLPTGKHFDAKVWCLTKKDFLSLIDRWNSLGGALWKYVSR